MEDMNIKSVRYPVATDQKLEKLALKLGRPKKQVVIQMVDYFYRSKKDPLDLGDELLKKELVNGNNKIIGFIKRQESDFLLPVFTSSGVLTTMANEHTRYLKATYNQLTEESKKADQLSFRVGMVEKGINTLQKQQEEKVLLKGRCRKILDYYINQRELLGWSTSNAKKEELQAHVRTSLDNL
jgi:hypothetical protein